MDRLYDPSIDISARHGHGMDPAHDTHPSGVRENDTGAPIRASYGRHQGRLQGKQQTLAFLDAPKRDRGIDLGQQATDSETQPVDELGVDTHLPVGVLAKKQGAGMQLDAGGKAQLRLQFQSQALEGIGSQGPTDSGNANLA